MSPQSGQTNTRASSTWDTKRSARRSWPNKRKWGFFRKTRSSPRSIRVPDLRSHSVGADYEIGRFIDYLESIGELDNTLLFVISDNGASGEGGPNGSVNENNFFNSVPDDMADNLALIDKLGSVETYNHYPTGWAMAFNTPFKLFKRSTWEGGVCDPLIVHWPKGIKAKGELRDQYTHCIDLVPTERITA